MAASPPRVCLVEPNRDLAAQLSGLLAQIGHYDVEHVTSLAEMANVADHCDVVVTTLDLPDIDGGAQTIDALCAALAEDGPGVVAVIPDGTDSLNDVYPYLWSRARDCIQAVLSAADLTSDQLARGIGEALSHRRSQPSTLPPPFAAPASRGLVQRYTYAATSSGPSAVTNVKLDQILERVREMQLEMASQSLRLRKLEESYVDRRADSDRLSKQMHGVSRRIKKIEETLSGESSDSKRPLAVRLDDLESSRASSTAWMQQLVAQTLPFVLTAIGTLVLFYVTRTAGEQRQNYEAPPAAARGARP